jgi:hypothetical protein
MNLGNLLRLWMLQQRIKHTMPNTMMVDIIYKDGHIEHKLVSRSELLKMPLIDVSLTVNDITWKPSILSDDVNKEAK